MPYLTIRDDTFHVSDAISDAWSAISAYPRNNHGLPLRPYPSGVYNGEAVTEGIYVDWQSDQVREFVYSLRTTRRPQPTHRQIAQTYGFQHHLHPYRAADAWARRVRDSVARGGPELRQGTDYRRYARYWSARQLAATASSAHRCFGIEIEYVSHNPGRTASGIEADLRSAGIAFTEAWHRYGRRSSDTGWALTYDTTVTAEIISDILPGDQASLDEVSSMLRIVRANGGLADQRQGMHVHLDLRDFSLADKVRLVDNVTNVQDALLAFCHPYRRNGRWSARMDAGRMAQERRMVAAGNNGTGDHVASAFNFGHVAESSARIEFRSLGWTLNGTKVRAWVRVLQALVTATKAGATFAPNTGVGAMLAVLRNHGLSQWAMDAFTVEVARRNGRVVTV